MSVRLCVSARFCVCYLFTGFEISVLSFLWSFLKPISICTEIPFNCKGKKPDVRAPKSPSIMLTSGHQESVVDRPPARGLQQWMGCWGQGWRQAGTGTGRQMAWGDRVRACLFS